MTKDYCHYPLVDKALSEQRRVFAHFESGMPHELERATLRALELIDAHVQALVKEHIMAVAVLMNCPPYIALKSKRFEKDYSARVQAMLDTHTTRNGITAENEDLIQVYSALFIAHGENMLAQIEQLSGTDRHWMQDIREGMEEYAEDRCVFEHKVEKGLFDIENDLISRTFAAIDAKLQKQPARPRVPPKPF